MITSLSLRQASAGSLVIINGSNFGATKGSSYVLFSDNGINWGGPWDIATWVLNSWSNTQITFTVPSPSGSGGQYAVAPGTTAAVSVTVGSTQSNVATLGIQ